MKKIGLYFTLILLMCLLQAHEFWLQPAKHQIKIGQACSLDLQVGEGFEGELWNYTTDRIISFQLHEKELTQDLTSKAKTGKGNNLTLSFEKAGTKLISLETNNAYIELEGKKFNAYLLEDGLFNALSERNEQGILEQKATEYYARNIKTLLQVGKQLDDSYKKNTGMPLEIIPLQNPYRLKKMQPCVFEVIFNGKPLEQAVVKAWHLHEGKVQRYTQFTNAQGKVDFNISPKGKWMISIVTMIPSENPEVEWQSYWGSFTFGWQ